MKRYYLCGNGQCLHRRSCRVFVHGRQNRSAPSRRLATRAEIQELPVCHICCGVDSVCLVCADVLEEENAIVCPCPHGHRLCADCMDEHIHRSCTQRPMDIASSCNHIGCPCGHESTFDPRGFSRSQFELWYAAIVSHLAQHARAEGVSTARFVSNLLDDILTLCCPACGLAFSDFDGCLALECRCGAFFCGLCLEHCDSWHECHAHVRNCSHNPTDQCIYMSMSKWGEVQRARTKTRLVAHLTDAAQTVSTTFALSLLVQLQPIIEERGIRVHLSDVLSLSTVRRDFWRLITGAVRHS